MRVLLVEDNITFSKDIVRELTKIADCETVWARSRDAAIAQLEGGAVRSRDPRPQDSSDR